ncbi:hypothetical protein TcCL_ESM10285 [Trypanosoma cruzi]|nr:hypothetical protein TcCL_ESM10285 [Trypanosoma cruzi]
MDDVIPRIANTLPRREKATFALLKADWPAFTSLCKTLLPAASTWLDIRSGILRAAERHIPRGSVTAQNDLDKQNGTSRVRRRSSTQSTHIASPGDSLLRAKFIQKCGGPKSSLTPWLRYASGSPCEKNWGLIQTKLAISSRRGGAAPSSTRIGCAPN